LAGENALAYFSKKKSFIAFAKKMIGRGTLAYFTKKKCLMTFAKK
jgi:hypothetical protein